MSLPSGWVDSLFARLTTRYGRSFSLMWEGLEIDAVKADWADVLGGFADKPAAIRYGLDNLPSDRPPTAPQFREMCRRSPDDTPRLPSPKADKKIAGEAVKSLGGMKIGRKPGLEWAHKLRDCELNHGGNMHAAGFPVPSNWIGARWMTTAQRDAWREALKTEAA